MSDFTIEYYVQADYDFEVTKDKIEAMQIVTNIVSNFQVCKNKALLSTFSNGYELKYIYSTKTKEDLFFYVIDGGVCLNFEDRKDNFVDLYVKKHNSLLPLKFHEEVDFFKITKIKEVIEKQYKFKNFKKDVLLKEDIKKLKEALIDEDTTCDQNVWKSFIDAGYIIKYVFTDNVDDELLTYKVDKSKCLS